MIIINQLYSYFMCQLKALIFIATQNAVTATFYFHFDQIALVDVLRALNVKPAGIIGHSAGEIACAYADNCLTKEQTVLCAYYRGLSCMETKLTKGAMAAVGKKILFTSCRLLLRTISRSSRRYGK